MKYFLGSGKRKRKFDDDTFIATSYGCIESFEMLANRQVCKVRLSFNFRKLWEFVGNFDFF